ncbi:hypothetical protein [Prescottella agglutinans]|uniref:Uncharacterized protein n=1 Tax=Prescottella agglutinans TaxID=1644129 RepID=A0ABT6MG06_9NOCA|nr:hypothetical protein [Prescottella agglutinans]MDH6283247.1 hypothetical protein [Prescottella agglutinans]
MKNALILVGAFVALAVLFAYWKVIVGVILVGLVLWGLIAGVCKFADKRRDRLNGEQSERSKLATRARIQNEQYLAGEDRGLYGNFRPESLD